MMDFVWKPSVETVLCCILNGNDDVVGPARSIQESQDETRAQGQSSDDPNCAKNNLSLLPLDFKEDICSVYVYTFFKISSKSAFVLSTLIPLNFHHESCFIWHIIMWQSCNKVCKSWIFLCRGAIFPGRFVLKFILITSKRALILNQLIFLLRMLY